MREEELETGIRAWLRSRGAIVYAEVQHPVGYRQVDFVGVIERRRVIVVEAKVSFSQHLRAQCLASENYAHEVWAAVPTRSTLPKLRDYEHFGVLCVDVAAGRAHPILEPRSQMPPPRWPGLFLPRCTDFHRTQVGGAANQRGVPVANRRRTVSWGIHRALWRIQRENGLGYGFVGTLVDECRDLVENFPKGGRKNPRGYILQQLYHYPYFEPGPERLSWIATGEGVPDAAKPTT